MTNDTIRKHFGVEDIYRFELETLRAAGYPEDYAEATAWALLEADKRGIFSHGVAGGTGLEEAVKRLEVTATVDPTARIYIPPQKLPTIKIINANGAPGHYTSKLAVDLVKEIARCFGIGKIYVNNANHFGAAGIWSEEIAKDGDLIGEVTCTTSAIAKVVGDDLNGNDYTIGAGTKIRVGTNPEAISIPHKDGIITLDMALTRMAASHAIKCAKIGEILTMDEYGADANYKSTRDPTKVFKVENGNVVDENGSIFPLGSTHAGYKGDGKLRMIEADNALGGGPIKGIDVTTITAERRISHTFYAQITDFNYTVEEAKERISEMMRDYEKYFGPRSRWPGDRAHACIKYALEHGIPYSEGQINTLKRATAHAGLEFNLQPVSEKEFPKELFRK